MIRETLLRAVAAPLADACAVAVERVLREFEGRLHAPPKREDAARLRGKLEAAQAQLADHRALLQAAHGVAAAAAVVCEAGLALPMDGPQTRARTLRLQQLVDEFERVTS